MRSFFDARSGLLLAGIATFILMGAGQAIFGPALPADERVFGLTTAEAGWLISAFWVGCVVGVTGMYVFGHTVTPRNGLAMLALGSALLASQFNWQAALLGAAAFGVGYGGLAVMFNPRVLEAFGPRGPSMLRADYLQSDSD